MGIPKFYPWFKQFFTKAIYTKIDKKYNVVAFDLNQWIHKNFINNSSILADQCFIFIQSILNSTCESGWIILVLDGACPHPKLEEQRKRRLLQDIDRLQISAGTEFMKQFAFNLLNRCKTLIHKYTIYFSDSNVPGEGEHKIINLILNENLTKYKILFISIDADAILLCILNNLVNVDVLRMYYNYINVVCIKTVLDCLPTSIMNFFVNISFLGNDYLPPLKTIGKLNWDIYCNEFDIFDIKKLCTGINNESENCKKYITYLSWLILYYKKPHDGKIPICEKPDSLKFEEMQKFSYSFDVDENLKFPETYETLTQFQLMYILPKHAKCIFPLELQILFENCSELPDANAMFKFWYPFFEPYTKKCLKLTKSLR